MTIELTYSGTTIQLPADLIWTDRDSWSPVSQSVATSITGATIIDSATRLSQRPITLEGDDEHAWVRYSTVLQLRAWASVAGREMTLSIDGTSYSVIFRHHEPPAVNLRPIVSYAAPDTDDWFTGELKFMEI